MLAQRAVLQEFTLRSDRVKMGFSLRLKAKVSWTRRTIKPSTSANGIDAVLTYKNKKLNGLLVPADVRLSYQIAAQAGRYTS